ncbi:DNA polymerase III subunit delta [Pelodictyon luteolum]|uniref:DNA-directed DNA polymerase n=1 Tax=Chlorobium luteolum (strain DSM 273 / BCRC 81028 / 2530) TaxID=319225 RepID=Q3B683_CHLL3|nr:DNA polymerase III subunit delta [Pelodictyon luteolum]ABB23148.1 DNA polymerase III, delta subunit [Pelodictyon luteolum DSM 273]
METLKKNILAGSLSPVYFFHGPESFLKEEFTALIRSTAFPDEAEAAANTHILYGPDITPGELVARASEYPMFTPRQLIVVRQFDKIKKPVGKDQQKQHEMKFAGYMKNPAEFTILVFDAEQLDKKDVDKPPYSLLKSFRHDFPLLKTPDLFAAARAHEAGWEFDPEALKAFTAYIQPSSREICQEIEKLTTYASSRQGERRITAADVYECVGISKTYNVFELEKAVAGRNLRLSSGISLMIMEREGQKEGLGNIVRYLTTFFMRLWKIAQPEVRAMPQGEIAKVLGMYGRQEYFVRSYLSYAGAFSSIQAERAITALKDTDAALKGLSPYPDEKYLLLRLMQQLLG